jgi:hypothetical protein
MPRRGIRPPRNRCCRILNRGEVDRSRLGPTAPYSRFHRSGLAALRQARDRCPGAQDRPARRVAPQGRKVAERDAERVRELLLCAYRIPYEIKVTHIDILAVSHNRQDGLDAGRRFLTWLWDRIRTGQIVLHSTNALGSRRPAINRCRARGLPARIASRNHQRPHLANSTDLLPNLVSTRSQRGVQPPDGKVGDSASDPDWLDHGFTRAL